MGIVTKVETYEDKDPELKMIGIITLEDIIEEIVQKDEEDDDDFVQIKGEKLRLKERLVLLFSDHTAGKQVTDEEK